MRAITVCVNYADCLRLTLAYNHQHFHSITIITTPKDYPNVYEVAREYPNTQILTTDLFTADGAHFNKYRSMEWGLDQIGRYGWLCVMDCDICIPKMVELNRVDGKFLRQGCLYTPLRRMCEHIPEQVPAENTWREYPIHRQLREWAGYFHLFFAESPWLGVPPWYPIDWRHAGGADSFMQFKCPEHLKIRPPWEVLHLGRAGHNWCGRTPEGKNTLNKLIRGRGHGETRFDGEKIQIPPKMIEIRDYCPMAPKTTQEQSEPPKTIDGSPSTDVPETSV